MRRRRLPFTRLWSTDPGFTALLWLLLAFLFVGHPLVVAFPALAIGIEILFSLILVSGVAATVKRTLPSLLVVAFATASLLITWGDYAFPRPLLDQLNALSAVVVCALLASVLLVQVFREGPITRHRIEGAIAAYLLLGIGWAFAYELVDLVLPGSFAGPLAPQQVPRDRHTGQFIYFSFITLTTVGYGDFTPLASAARSLAVLEALSGQLFPAILLARLVSMELEWRRR